MGVREEIEKSGLTPKAFVIGTIVTLFWTWLASTRGNRLVNFSIYGGIALNNQNGSTFLIAMGASMLTILIFSLINCIKPVFSKQEIALIVLMPLFGMCWCGYNLSLLDDLIPFGMGLGYVEADTLSEAIKYIPDVLGPKDPSFWNSGWLETPYSIPPYAELLAGQMGWLILWQLFSALSAAFMVLLVRRLYVNIEYLSSPLVIMYSTMAESATLVESAKSEGKSRLVAFFKNKYLLISFVIGFIYTYLHWDLVNTPPLLSLWLFGTGTYASNRGWIPIGGQRFRLLWPRIDDLTTMALIPWVPLYISLIPMEVSWMTMQRFDVLYGFLVGWFILYVLWPLIEYGMGRYPPMSPGTGNSSICNRIWWGDPTGLVSLFIPYGIAIGLAVYPIWRNRRAMAPILTSLFRKPPKDIDQESPFPYRFIWIGLIISVIIAIATYSMTGAAIVPVIIWILINLFVILGTARMMAETGGYMGMMIYVPYSALASGFLGAMLCSAFGIMGDPTPSNVMTLLALNWEMRNGDAFVAALIAGAVAVAFFQVGERVKADRKSTGRMMLYAVPLAIISTIVFGYWWYGYLPLCESFKSDVASDLSTTIRDLVQGVELYQYGESVTGAHVSAAGPNMALLVLGIAIAFIIPMLRVRMPWMRVSVAGIMFGMLFGYAWWFTAIVALLIKYIIIKVGGIEPHDKKLMPICVGLAAGSFADAAWHHIMGVLRQTVFMFLFGTWD